MSAQIDWATSLRGMTVGVTLSIAAIIAPPVVAQAAPQPSSPARQTRSLTVRPDYLGTNKAEASLHTWSAYAEVLPVEGARETLVMPSLAQELCDVAPDLSKEMLAHLMDVSRPAFHKWLRGGGMSVEKTWHAEALLSTIRTLRPLRGTGLRAFLETPGYAGRPADLLAHGDTRAVIGLALRRSPVDAPPSTISAMARERSGLPGRLRTPPQIAAGAQRRDRAAWQEARERLRSTATPDESILSDPDDDPVVVSHIHVIG